MYTGRAAASPLTEDTPPLRNSLVANSYLLWYNQVHLKLQGWAPWVWALTVPSHCGIPNKAGRRKYRQNGGLWEPESPVIPREQAVTPGQTRDGQRCWDSSLGPPPAMWKAGSSVGTQQREPEDSHGFRRVCACVCSRTPAVRFGGFFFFLLDASTCHSLPDSSLLLTGHLHLFLWLWIQKPRVVPTEQLQSGQRGKGM